MTKQTIRKTKTDRVVRTFRPILAAGDGDGKIPTRIELLKVGFWDTPKHGVFEITAEDLHEYVNNFNNGTAQADGSGITIDYDHETGPAAGWIKSLKVGVDDENIMTLFASVEWSGQGKRDLIEKNYKHISPEFYPAARGGWEDPEQYGRFIQNVLAAAGLVNRPLFKGLKKIMASEGSGEERRKDKNVIYISASEKEKTMPTLEEVRAKDASALTEEDKAFLVEQNKAGELSAEEQEKFGLEVTKETEAQKTAREEQERQIAEQKAAEEAEAAKAAEEARKTAPDLTEAQPVLASAVKGDEGKVILAASDVKAMHDRIQTFERAEIERSVKAHAERGALKADQVKPTVDMLVSASGSTRTQLEDHLKHLPDNAVLADTKGETNKAGEVETAVDKIGKLVKEKIAASEGTTYDDALMEVRRDNPELVKQYDQEQGGIK